MFCVCSQNSQGGKNVRVCLEREMSEEQSIINIYSLEVCLFQSLCVCVCVCVGGCEFARSVHAALCVKCEVKQRGALFSRCPLRAKERTEEKVGRLRHSALSGPPHSILHSVMDK